MGLTTHIKLSIELYPPPRALTRRHFARRTPLEPVLLGNDLLVTRQEFQQPYFWISPSSLFLNLFLSLTFQSTVLRNGSNPAILAGRCTHGRPS
jgi:hypothetical protein